MTALLRPPLFPPGVIKMREDWGGGWGGAGGGGCPLLVLSPWMHLNNKTFSYRQLGWPSEWRPPAEQQLINSLIFPQSANEVIKIKVMQKEGGSQQQLLDTRRLYLTRSSRPEKPPPSPCMQEREELTEPLNSFDVFFFNCLFCFLILKFSFQKCSAALFSPCFVKYIWPRVFHILILILNTSQIELTIQWLSFHF